MEIPQGFADTYLGGKYLGVGGPHREAGTEGSSSGPSLIACEPWSDGNPPTNGSDISATVLLYYQRVEGSLNCADLPQKSINGYDLSDSYTGGAWMDHNGKTAVVFFGYICRHSTHYYDGCDGCPPGWCWNEDHTACISNASCCDGCDANAGVCADAKGYVCGYGNDAWGQFPDDATPGYTTEIVFYDPADFALAAQSLIDPQDIQPYDRVDISSYLWPGCSQSFGGVAYDRTNGLVYVTQFGIDNLQSGQPENVIAVCHVFRFGNNQSTSGGIAISPYSD